MSSLIVDSIIIGRRQLKDVQERKRRANCYGQALGQRQHQQGYNPNRYQQQQFKAFTYQNV